MGPPSFVCIIIHLFHLASSAFNSITFQPFHLQRRSTSSPRLSNSAIMWDPETQTYTDGKIPSHHGALEMEELLQCNDGKLKIFGYGSLCWHPGSDGVLSLASTNDDQNVSETSNRVTTGTGRAIGYQRCWCQRSADHRPSRYYGVQWNCLYSVE